MESTIYKPGAYNTPGVYNGAGGIYKGLGVYNDGENTRNIHFKLDIANFDPLNPVQDGVNFYCNGVVINENVLEVAGGISKWFSMAPQQFENGWQKLIIKSKYNLSISTGVTKCGLWLKNSCRFGESGINVIQGYDSIDTSLNFDFSLDVNWDRYTVLAENFPFTQIEEYTPTSSKISVNGNDILIAYYTSLPTSTKEWDFGWDSGSGLLTLSELEIDIEYD